MRRVLPLVVVAAALTPLSAGAATPAGAWQGVVIAKDSSRAVLVAAGADGAVRTLRTAGRVQLGSRIGVTALRLSDGTFRASGLHVLGRTMRTRLKGTVVRYERGSHRYLLAAGGSVVAVKTASVRKLADSAPPLPAGSQVTANTTVQSNGTLTTPQLTTVGQTSTLQLAGILTAVSGQSVQVAVAGTGLVNAAVPAGMTLPTLANGDEVQLVVSVATDGSLTLVSIQRDTTSASGGPGVGVGPSGEVDVEGTIGALTDTSITLQPGAGASPVVCTVSDLTLTDGFTVGDTVDAVCTNQNGTLTLTALDLYSPGQLGSAAGGGNSQGDDSESDDDSGGGSLSIGSTPLGGLSASGRTASSVAKQAAETTNPPARTSPSPCVGRPKSEAADAQVGELFAATSE